MVQVIYGDVLLLIDFCMNFFVLHTTGIVLRRKTKFFCLAVASALGGLYSVAKVFVNGNDIVDCAISFAVGLLMCYVAFGGFRFLKTAFVFFGTSALVGGIMFLVYFMLGSYHTDIFGTFRSYAYSHIPLWLFMLLAALSFLFSWCFSYLGREREEQKEANIVAEYANKKVTLSLLLDSGNLVKEPISGKNVILVRDEIGKALLSKEAYNAIRNRDGDFLLRNRFRMVSISGIEGKKRIYYGFRPDKIFMKDGNQAILFDAYFAICEPGVNFEGKDGIAHPALFT